MTLLERNQLLIDCTTTLETDYGCQVIHWYNPIEMIDELHFSGKDLYGSIKWAIGSPTVSLYFPETNRTTIFRDLIIFNEALKQEIKNKR